MQKPSEKVSDYLSALPLDRQQAVETIRAIILKHYGATCEEVMLSGMINYVVPLSTYPKGYHCTKGEPLPFMAIASQKQYLAWYPMALYARPDLAAWFQQAWQDSGLGKPDMGKVCVRFKKMDRIPFDLIDALCQKMSVDDYIAQYDAMRGDDAGKKKS